DRALADADERPADNRRRGTRYSGNDGERLKEADEERFAISDLGKLDVDVDALIESLEHDERDSADEKGGEHDVDISEQICLDQLVHREADDPRRDERDDELREHLRSPELAPIQHDDREDGAELNDDLEALQELRIGKPERGRGENQMRRRRHRQKLGETFDDAENQGVRE